MKTIKPLNSDPPKSIGMDQLSFFRSQEHQERFVQTMNTIGKVYDGWFDPEYGAALYILTSDLFIWEEVSGYVSRDGIGIARILKKVHLSSGESVLIKLAGNLFNGNEHIDPLELLRLDETNFTIAMTALKLRRDGLQELQPQQSEQLPAQLQPEQESRI
jgi:hypothetical protein